MSVTSPISSPATSLAPSTPRAIIRRALDRARAAPARTRRIVVLVFAITLMSIADLLLTLTYVREVGMVELNPIARAVMAHDSPALLALWKVGIVAGASVIIFIGRRSRITEGGSWLACMLLAMLTVHWLRYIDAAHELTPYLDAFRETPGSKWIAMTP